MAIQVKEELAIVEQAIGIYFKFGLQCATLGVSTSPVERRGWGLGHNPRYFISLILVVFSWFSVRNALK
jgi:hypothetical protein